MQARLADGTIIDIADEQVRVWLSFLDFESQELLHVIDMNYRYDIILGIPWLQAHEPWVNWRTGEMGNSHPVMKEVGSWRDQHLYSLERQDSEDPNTCLHSVGTADRELVSSPKQYSPRKSVAAEERDADKLTDVPPQDQSITKTRSRPLSFADEHELPLEQVRSIAGHGRRQPVPSHGRTIPGTAQVALGSEFSEACMGDGLRHSPVRTPKMSDSDTRSKLRGSRLVDASPITDLPTDAAGLLSLECISLSKFLQELEAGEITEIAALCSEPAHEINQVDSKQQASIALQWDAVTGNPAYPVLKEYQDVFPTEVPSRLPIDKGIRHEIDLVPGTKYCVTRQWPLPREQVEAIDAFFAKSLAAGRVRESKSPHSAPTFCVKKASGGWRIVHAYNRLNAATIPAQTPIPRRDAIIDAMSGATIFSCIDLTDGYYQLLMRESDIPLTACSTPSGMLWEWLVMPQGLKNAPATFNRLITHLFRPMRSIVQTYFDDIFVFSRARDGLTDIEAHNEDLRKVLQCMRDNNLYANVKKCIFSASEIPVLGCFVGKDGIRADPRKVRAISDWPTPRSVKDLRKWLGLANYLHRFSKNYADMARPLTTLLKKEVDFEWTSVHDAAFAAIKRSLQEAPILALPDFDTPFWVVCDASDYAIGCALLQADADGREHVVSYQSRALKPAEKNYPVHDKELLAMKYALVKFRVYLLGSKPFVIYTDHASLRTATQSPHLSQRMARWLSFFAEYNFTVAYKPGRENILADALSRRPDYESQSMDELMGISVVGSSLYDDIRSAYDDDSQCRALIAHFNADDASKVSLSDALRASLHRFSYGDRLLYYRVHPSDTPRIVVPSCEDLRSRILYEFHDTPMGGHIGREKTYAAVSARYYWRHMYKHVERYIRKCAACQSVKSSACSAAPLQSLPVPHECWTDVSLDFMFGFPRDRRRHNGILVFVDRLSKMVHLVPCSKGIDGKKSASHFIDHVFKHHGMPDRLVSDRDPRFTGHFWQEVFRRLGTRLKMSTAAHPQSDGQTERANRVIEDMLRSFCAQFPQEWSSLLPLVEFAMNNSVHASTGYTPFFLNALRHPRTPVSLSTTDESTRPSSAHATDVDRFLTTRSAALRFVRDNLAAAQDRQKQSADRHGRRVTHSFDVGDFVYLSTKDLPKDAISAHLGHSNSKLLPRFIGPFKVTARAGPLAYELGLPAHFSRVHPVFYVGLLKAHQGESPLEEGVVAPTSEEASRDPPDPPLQRASAVGSDGAAQQSSGDLRAAAPRAPLAAEPPFGYQALAGPSAPSHGPPHSRSHPSASATACASPPPPRSGKSSTPPEGERAPNRRRASESVVQTAPSPPEREPFHGSQPHSSADPIGSHARRARPENSLNESPLESLEAPLETAAASRREPSDLRRQAATSSVCGSVPSSPIAVAHAQPNRDLQQIPPPHLVDETSPVRPALGSPLRGTNYPSRQSVARDETTRDLSPAPSHDSNRSHRTNRPSGECDDATAPPSGRVGHTGIAGKQGMHTPLPLSLPTQDPPNTDTQYTVDRLIRRRRNRSGQVEYLVHWDGYAKSQRSWEPRRILLEDCPTLVHEFERAMNKRRGQGDRRTDEASPSLRA